MMYLLPLLIIIIGCLALHFKNDDDMPDGHA
ncbi:hypothetical protein [Escherichia phage vB_EcoP_PHB19]|uniref:Uncharacterized protein n=1 Tax=Escherichia phage vB_EcoP_PHB19 TaxID=2698729 RepID=A0A6B9RHU1_9CAUD|nr:hypothetical protein [Escherichia phage vB_EcoP_PHB19]